MKRVGVVSLFVLLSPPAWAFCSEPSTRITLPDAPGSYGKPRVPYCLSGFAYSGRHTCDSWEIDSYKRDVEEYVEKLQEYADEALRAAQQAARFARDAQDYAECEVKEVASQHK